MPHISVVLLSWDGLELTTRCVESLRSGTANESEIVIVDNGSQPAVQEAVSRLADKVILNSENRGFSAGMNQGLEVVQSPTVVFANNDTVFPPDWDALLLETLESEGAGIVVPAVTASGNPRTVREAPGTSVERILPFTEPPSGIVYVMATDIVRRFGGWSTEYRLASAEDWDLCFTVWLNGMEIYYDTRVMVEHVSKGTASEKLDDWRVLWRENRNRFLDKWSGDVSHLVVEKSDTTERRSQELEVVIDWMRRFYHTRDELISVRSEMRELRRSLESKQKQIDSLRDRAGLGYQLKRLPARIVRKVRRLAGGRGASGSDQRE